MIRVLKQTYLILTMLIVIALSAGCSDPSNSKTPETARDNPPIGTANDVTNDSTNRETDAFTTSPAEGGVRANLGDEAHLDGVKMTLLGVKTLEHEGLLLLLPEFHLKNDGTKPVNISPYFNMTSYIDGVEVTDGSVLDAAAVEGDFLSGNVEPGDELRGAIPVRAHADWQTLEVIVEPYLLDAMHFTLTRDDAD